MNETSNLVNIDDDGSSAAIENIYPALTECFAIIICGYLAGRMNLISDTEAKGINTFVGTFSLPSLIFMSLAQLDLSAVNWLFLLSILIAKSLVFATVILVTLLVGRLRHFGRAGIFAIFCTQSNDFAIGYPIVAALYKTTHPDYASYLYLMAPISLAILNPISFVFMEIGKRRDQNDDHHEDTNDHLMVRPLPLNNTRCQMIVSLMKSIFFNPIIFMTILGILGNLVFHHHVPIYLGGMLEVLGSAFSASALFLLGLRMVGKVHKLRGPTLVVPGILIMVKLLALPLVTREVISLLRPGENSTETGDLSTYGFLYGTFPSAPTVFVFATQYALDVDLIASAMVACTFISAPLMFVSAKMITITKCNPSQYIRELNAFTFDISIIGVIAGFWVLLVFVLTKKITRLPHKITACLIISHLLSCLGAILWNTLDTQQTIYGNIQFALFTVGVYSTRLWTTILAVTLLFLQCRSLCYVLKLQPVFVFLGWGIPIIMAAILLLIDTHPEHQGTRNPNFVYGTSQAILAVSLLVLCFTVTVGCLILMQRHRRRISRYWDSVMQHDDDESAPLTNDTGAIITIGNGQGDSIGNGVGHALVVGNGGLPTINEDSPIVDIEDLFSGATTSTSAVAKRRLPATINDDSGVDISTNGGDDGIAPSSSCLPEFGCHGPKGGACRGIAQQYQQPIDNDLELIEEETDSHDPQILRHQVLLILLLCSMFVGLALSIWTLVIDELSGIYVELSFLDATLNFGQSIIVFAIFGLDTREIFLPVLKYWRKLWYGANTLSLPATWHELSNETRLVCDQFVTHHLESCRSTIASDKRWRLKIYRNVFAGHRFIDWLIDVGLARDRVEAANYGRHLVEGKVLKHINGVYHFYDRNLLYTFV